MVTIVWFIGFVIVWEILAYLLVNVFHDQMAIQKLPYLHEVAVTFVSNIGTLLESSWATLTKAFFGFVIGGTIGFLIAIIMSWSGFLEKMLFPYLIISQMIPVLGLAPIIYSIVKDGDMARVVIAAYITFFPVSINMLSGLKSVEKDKKNLLYSYAAKKGTVYRKLMIPSSLPYLFTGLKIAAPFSITAAIVVEMLGTTDGIGVKILYTLYYGANGALMFWSSVITSALLGLAAYGLICLLERLLVPWKRQAALKNS